MKLGLTWSLIAGAALLCGCPAGTTASVVATVTVPAAMKCTCIRVVAITEDGATLSSQPLPRPASGELRVAIFEPQGESRPVTLVARGYVGSGCSEPLLLNEESDPRIAEFLPGPGGTATLVLRPPPSAMDVDGDLFRSDRAGGPDCDDLRGATNPVATEGCGDGADDDCDGKADCDDETCLDADCGGGRTCSMIGTCVGREGACTNGLDDDLDGLSDCRDQDCTGATCDDGNPCTRQDACNAGACSGAAVVCDAPPVPACMASTGTCNTVDGGCSYQAAPGRTCSGGFCLHDAGCGPLFSYNPSNFSPPDAGDYVLLSVDCGAIQLNTDPADSTPWSLPGACGTRTMPRLIPQLQPGAGEAVVIPVESLTVASGSEVVVSGPRPAIFAVFGDAVIDGRIRMIPAGLSSNGAGTVTGSCATGRGSDGGSSLLNGAGGGGGGGYGSAGGRGGTGASGGTAGVAGTVAGANELVPLLGGCAGGQGGVSGTNTGGNGGGGGGALQLSASGSIVIRGGGMGVPGRAGEGGRQHQSGAGGGGSGGAVLVEAQSLRLTLGGHLIANGGGGGAGDSCCTTNLADGNNGNDGDPDSSNSASGGSRQFAGGGGGTGGQGGSANGAAGPGGNGNSWNPTTGATYYGAGGGGGGGTGRLRINVTADCSLGGGRLSGAVTSNRAGDAGCP